MFRIGNKEASEEERVIIKKEKEDVSKELQQTSSNESERDRLLLRIGKLEGESVSKEEEYNKRTNILVQQTKEQQSLLEGQREKLEIASS